MQARKFAVLRKEAAMTPVLPSRVRSEKARAGSTTPHNATTTTGGLSLARRPLDFHCNMYLDEALPEGAVHGLLAEFGGMTPT